MATNFSTSGSRPNQIVFPSPLYVAQWLNDRYFLVGGGGGETKFGMSNFVVLFEVIEAATPGGDQWKQRASLDFGEKVIWCTSDIIKTESTSPGKKGKATTTYQLAVSSKDCCYVIECKLDPEVSMTKSSEAALQFDPVNGDKKPVSTTPGLVWAAQDDNSIAVFNSKELVKGVAGAKAKVAEIKQWDTTPLWRGRIRTVLTKAVSETQALLVTGSEDKRILCMLLSTKGGTDNSKIEIQQVVVVTEQHLKLPFKLMSSGFKTMHWDPVRGPTALVVNVFDALKADTVLIQVDDVVQTVEGSKSTKKIAFNDNHRLTVKRDGVSDLALQTSLGLAGTVEGKVFEIERSAGGTFTKLGRSNPLHDIPISSVCLSPSGAVLSCDIGQRVNLTYLGKAKSQSKLLSVLPPTFVRPSWHRTLVLFVLLLLLGGLVFLIL